MEAACGPPSLRVGEPMKSAGPETLLLFAHTTQGNKALAELVEAGVPHEAIQVVGDLGAAVSQPGAERHVTLDALHVPAEERQIYMDTIRDGGVVLAADTSLVDDGFLKQVGERHDAMRVTRSSGAVRNVSHNVAG